MTSDAPRRLRMFAGPNGSGKTSLVRRLARDFTSEGLFQLHRYINADDIATDLREGRGVRLDDLGHVVTAEQVSAALRRGGRLQPDHPFLTALQVANARLMDPPGAADGYVAAAVADFLRDELFAAGRSFAFETVMSHRSKTDFFAQARAAGYRTYLYFIATETSHLNIYRVRNRVALGGHDVPENKIIERYQRCLGLVGAAIASSYRAFLFDNSGTEPVWLAQVTPEREWQFKVATDALPTWFKKWVLPHAPALPS